MLTTGFPRLLFPILLVALAACALSGCRAADGGIDVPRTVQKVRSLGDDARNAAAVYGAHGKAGAQQQILELADQIDGVLIAVEALDAGDLQRADVWTAINAATLVADRIVQETDDAHVAVGLTLVASGLRHLRDEFAPFPAPDPVE